MACIVKVFNYAQVINRRELPLICAICISKTKVTEKLKQNKYLRGNVYKRTLMLSAALGGSNIQVVEGNTTIYALHGIPLCSFTTISKQPYE